MAKSLVIVESPAKARTINKYLGPDFIVDASLGHVKDLPKNGLSIDIEAGFVPTYEIIHGKADVIKRLSQLASRCEQVYLATDPDREGEAIASHIASELGAKRSGVRRVEFREITKGRVASAMRSPREIDTRMVAAQEARRVMDRLIGYKVSPFLWGTFRGEARGLSAGRVQSVALRLVVERERAIASFLPIDYWNLIGHFRTSKGDEIVARLVRHDGIDLRNPTGSAADLDPEAPKTFVANEKEAQELRDRALRERYAISSITRKELKRAAPAPFTTSTLQQDAGRRLRMPTKRVMQVAQKLYEGVEVGGRGRVGLITYMRTDSVRVSDEAAAAAEEFIYENYGKEYLPGARREHAKKSKLVQDAHEAIRPTDVALTPKEARKHLDADAAGLYELIWTRFVASRMAPAVIDQTTVDIEGGPFAFRANGRITRFRGWMQVYGDEEAAESQVLGAKRRGSTGDGGAEPSAADCEEAEELSRALPESIRIGESLSLEKLETRRSATKPPPRYTESLLVKELEAKGIGRPSTYASIIATIQERGYVEQKQRKLYATELGMRVCDALVGQFPALFDVKFTARMEGDLDSIAQGKATYLKVMQGFYDPFERALRSAQLPGGASRTERALPTRGRARTEGVPSDMICPKCGAPMVLRNGRYGPFHACTAFPDCRTTVPAVGGVAVTASADAKSPATRSRGLGSGKRGGRKEADAAQPRARSRRKADPTRQAGEGGEGSTGNTVGDVICRECGAPMVRRRSKNGEFLGCSTFPKCRHTEALERGIACPQCGQGRVVQRRGGRFDSVFFGCSRYPDCRFTSSQKPVAQACPRCGHAWAVEMAAGVSCPKCGGGG